MVFNHNVPDICQLLSLPTSNSSEQQRQIVTGVLQSLGKPGYWDSQLQQWQQLLLSYLVSELLPLIAANAIALKSWVSGSLALKTWHISGILPATGTPSLPWHLCSSLFLPLLLYGTFQSCSKFYCYCCHHYPSCHHHSCCHHYSYSHNYRRNPCCLCHSYWSAATVSKLPTQPALLMIKNKRRQTHLRKSF